MCIYTRKTDIVLIHVHSALHPHDHVFDVVRSRSRVRACVCLCVPNVTEFYYSDYVIIMNISAQKADTLRQGLGDKLCVYLDEQT